MKKLSCVNWHSSVFFDVNVEENRVGRLEIDLYADTPELSENFRALCTGEKGKGRTGKPLHYRGIQFHKIQTDYFVEGGDIIL